MDSFKISEKQYPNNVRKSSFYQGLKDKGLLVMEIGNVHIGFHKGSIAILHSDSCSVDISCLATHEEQRCQGAATQLLKTICEVADETNTKLTIPIPAHEGWHWEDLLIHIGVSHPAYLAAIKPKDRMPETMVACWLEKFGFAFTGIGKEGSREMQRSPNK